MAFQEMNPRWPNRDWVMAICSLAGLVFSDIWAKVACFAEDLTHGYVRRHPLLAVAWISKQRVRYV